MKETSSIYSLDWQDAGKGLIVAIVGAAVSAIEAALTTTPIVLNWKPIGLTALAAGLAYLTKNFFTPTKVVTQPE